MPTRPKVSVCVPIYNTALFIERCARSLFEQTLDNIEYIFVDDKSPDNSVEILLRISAEYPSRKDHIKLIRHERNKGLSGARTSALKAVTGEYVIHCDSDDWVEPFAYEAMYNLAKQKNADIVITDYYVNYAKKQRYVTQCGEGNGADITRLLLSGRLHCAVWNKLVRTNIYEKTGLPEPNLDMWEDVVISVRNAFYARTVTHFPTACIHYNQHNINSYTAATVFSEKTIQDLIRVVSVLRRFLEEHNVVDQYAMEFIWLKLNVKRALLLHSKDSNLRKLQNIYPETTKYILKQKNVPLYYRYALWAANNNHPQISEFMLKILGFIKQIRK